MKTKRLMVMLLALTLCVSVCLTLTACSGEKTIDSFIKSMEGEMDALRADMGDSIDLSLEARGNSLAYVLRFKEDTGLENGMMANALDSTLNTMTSTFTGVLEELKKEVPSAESVIVEYQDVNGEVITSKEFK